MKALKKLWAFIANLFTGLDTQVKKWVPVAINTVEAVKNFESSKPADFIEYLVCTAVPGDADDIAVKATRTIIREWAPKLLLELYIVETITETDDINEKLQLILEKIKLSSNEAQNFVYHGLASVILEKLADGKLTWSESVVIAEYYFKNIKKKE